WVKANEKLDMRAREAETLAIVGESGCGKSTFAKVLLGLEQAQDGAAKVLGDDFSRLPAQRRNQKQISRCQMVFQNPFDTLNPSHTIGGQLGRVIRKFGVARGRADVQAKVDEMLDLVKLPRDFANRLPRQLSGGQKQRVGIARAFVSEPSCVVADEPVSALDASVAAAVTRLLNDIQHRSRTTMILISHDIHLVRHISDSVVVMYLGHIVEHGDVEQVFAPPYHPYTEALLSAVPQPDPDVTKKEIVLEGSPPSPLDPPTGCPFHTRCPRKLGEICEREMPPEVEIGDGHGLRCHIPVEELRAVEPVFAVPADDAVPAAGS
ncbi:MAG: ABC transporter ATP-binding protein, partial [Alphaproteobacteria bacterium]|nr:ABC transporter ATP-binding protein [Alphaproteobacteria bacterium]